MYEQFILLPLDKSKRFLRLENKARMLEKWRHNLKILSLINLFNAQ